MFERRDLDRRTFLKYGMNGAAAVGLTGLLAACGASAGSSAGSAADVTGMIPAYVPFPNNPIPDLPGNEFGLADGYLTYPKNPPRVTSGLPGDGSEVSGFVLTNDPIVPGLDRNQYWQEVNRRLGVTVKQTWAPSGDYVPKLATIVASTDMPDLVQIQGTPPALPDLLEAKFQDLAPFIAGDAVKAYPALANIPDYFWRTSVMYNGGIYGIPIAAYKMPNYLFQRDDLIAARGLNPAVASWDEFVELCKEVNDPRNSQWALSHVVADTAVTTSIGTIAYAQQCLGVPNVWGENGGRFTSYYEVEETKEALDATAQLVRAGYVHPDAFSGTTLDFVTNFAIGRAVMSLVGLTSLPRYVNLNVIGDRFDVGGTAPVPFHSDSKPAAWQRMPAFSFTAVKKADDDRIRMILEVMNYLASPFGSEEYLFINYGLQGVDWNYGSDGEPAVTEVGKTEVTGFGLQYLSAPPRVLYTPGIAELVKKQHTILGTMMETSTGNPALGLYSETDGRSGNQLATRMLDAQREILKGNQPLSSWDDAVATWRSSGGDKIRDEYEKAFAAQHS